jgi:hypothetical protein
MFKFSPTEGILPCSAMIYPARVSYSPSGILKAYFSFK